MPVAFPAPPGGRRGLVWPDRLFRQGTPSPLCRKAGTASPANAKGPEGEGRAERKRRALRINRQSTW